MRELAVLNLPEPDWDAAPEPDPEPDVGPRCTGTLRLVTRRNPHPGFCTCRSSILQKLRKLNRSWADPESQTKLGKNIQSLSSDAWATDFQRKRACIGSIKLSILVKVLPHRPLQAVPCRASPSLGLVHEVL